MLAEKLRKLVLERHVSAGKRWLDAERHSRGSKLSGQGGLLEGEEVPYNRVAHAPRRPESEREHEVPGEVQIDAGNNGLSDEAQLDKTPWHRQAYFSLPCLALRWWKGPV